MLTDATAQASHFACSASVCCPHIDQPGCCFIFYTMCAHLKVVNEETRQRDGKISHKSFLLCI